MQTPFRLIIQSKTFKSCATRITCGVNRAVKRNFFPLLEILLTNIRTPNPFISINGALRIHLLPENLARRNTCVLVKQEASSPPHSPAQR